MFINVVLPAPFSPSSACTSPRRTSKSTWSFASTPGKRFVIPRTSRTGRSSTVADSKPVRRRRAAWPAFLVKPMISRSRLRHLDLAGDDEPLEPVHLRDVGLRHLRADLADADAPVLQVEEHVRSAAERAVLGRTDDAQDPEIHALELARQDVLPEVRLVDVDADPPDVLVLSGTQRAEAARAGDVVDDLRACRDLVQRQRLALVLLGEGSRIVDLHLDAGHALLRTGDVTGEELLDRRNCLTADAADHVAAGLLCHQGTKAADEVAALLHRELRAHDVRRLGAVERSALHVIVGDRELDALELVRDLLLGIGKQVPRADDDVVLLGGERREVRDVVLVRRRLR